MKTTITSLLVLFCIATYAQTVPSQDSLVPVPQKAITLQKTSKLTYKEFIIPAVLISYGAIALESKSLKNFNNTINKEINLDHPHRSIHVDDYSQFAPGVAVFGLQAFGIKGKNSAMDEAIIYAMSIGISTVVVTPLKRATHVMRPDISADNSFPSGHTTIAFASAELLRREYWDVSPWIGVAGYAVATGTGFLRIYNEKHWFSDVVAGAGIGIASTNLAYWLHSKINWGKKHKQTASVFPIYENGGFAVGFISQF